MAASAPGAPGGPDTWGECLFCGDAVPPGSPTCPICGAENPIRAAQIPVAPAKVRRRLKTLGALRTVLVVGAIILLAWAVVTPVLSGPPTIADPLTQAGTYIITPSNETTLSGEVSGGDYILGNYSVFDPIGLSVTLVIYNTSEYVAHMAGDDAGNQSWMPPSSTGEIQFAAAYTDTYYFVFENRYPVSSGFTEQVYIKTAYTPDVDSFDVIAG